MKHDMKGQPTVIVEDVADYRAAIPQVVKEGDCVLEVGCHEGVTTRRIAKEVGPSGRVYGVDTSKVCIERSQVVYKNEENLTFHLGSALDISFLLKLSDKRYDVIFLDISGSRDLETLIPLMESYESALKPRNLIVKSFRLKRLYVNCTLFQIHPPAPGEKGPNAYGTGEWKGVTQISNEPLPKPPKANGPSKGHLPVKEDGNVDLDLLQANAKCNAHFSTWGSGQTVRKERRRLKKEEKETNPMLRECNARLNSTQGCEEHERSLINKEYNRVLLDASRAARTAIREIARKTETGPILRWCKPLGKITWEKRE